MILALSDWWGLAAATGAAVAYAVLALAAPRLGPAAVRGVLLAAWLLHALALADGLLGEPPRFGFAPGAVSGFRVGREAASDRRSRVLCRERF